MLEIPSRRMDNNRLILGKLLFTEGGDTEGGGHITNHSPCDFFFLQSSTPGQKDKRNKQTTTTVRNTKYNLKGQGITTNG